jgi:hypothetical protein
MKIQTLLFLSILALSGATAPANAAVFKCFNDPVACPTGDHTRCIGYGWCGPDCDTCREGGKSTFPQDTTPAPEAPQPEAPLPEATLPEACADCHSQGQPSPFCVQTCHCTSAYCGSW